MMETNIISQLAENSNLGLQITASELREFVHVLYLDEQKKMKDALASHREKPTLSRKETAKILGVSLATLWAWAKSGYLVPVKIGTKVLYRASDVDALLEKNLANKPE